MSAMVLLSRYHAIVKAAQPRGKHSRHKPSLVPLVLRLVDEFVEEDHIFAVSKTGPW